MIMNCLILFHLKMTYLSGLAIELAKKLFNFLNIKDLCAPYSIKKNVTKIRLLRLLRRKTEVRLFSNELKSNVKNLT